MKQNQNKIFIKNLMKKQKKHNKNMLGTTYRPMFSRVIIQTYISQIENKKTDTIKKLDAALGLLKLKTSNKQNYK